MHSPILWHSVNAGSMQQSPHEVIDCPVLKALPDGRRSLSAFSTPKNGSSKQLKQLQTNIILVFILGTSFFVWVVGKTELTQSKSTSSYNQHIWIYPDHEMVDCILEQLTPKSIDKNQKTLFCSTLNTNCYFLILIASIFLFSLCQSKPTQVGASARLFQGSNFESFNASSMELVRSIRYRTIYHLIESQQTIEFSKPWTIRILFKSYNDIVACWTNCF